MRSVPGDVGCTWGCGVCLGMWSVPGGEGCAWEMQSVPGGEGCAW